MGASKDRIIVDVYKRQEYGYRDADSDGAFTWIDGTEIQGLYPAHGYQVTSRIKAKENAFASERTEPLNVSTRDTLRIVGNGTQKWNAKGTYGAVSYTHLRTGAYHGEHINGKWWAFNETGYAKTGWLRDEDCLLYTSHHRYRIPIRWNCRQSGQMQLAQETL